MNVLQCRAETRQKTQGRLPAFLMPFLLFFCLFLPLAPFGNRLELAEPLIYLATAGYILLQGAVRMDKMTILCAKFVGFFGFIQMFAVLLAHLSGNINSVYGGDDFYQFRLALQLFCAVYLTSNLFDPRKMAVNEFKAALFCACFILTLPAVVTLLQFFDVAGLKMGIVNIYKPTYGSESMWVRLEYRVTSLFVSSYISGVLMMWSGIFTASCLLRGRFGPMARAALMGFVLLDFLAEIYTLRTGLLFLPVGVVLVAFLAMMRERLSRIIPALIYMAMGVIALYVFLSVYAGEIFTGWALEVFSLFDPSVGRESISSFYTTAEGNRGAWQFIFSDPILFFIPAQYQTDAEGNFPVFGESQYVHDVLMYGIYMPMLYFWFLGTLAFRGWRSRNYFLPVMALLSLVISWKGGNGVLLAKSVIPFGFMLVASTTLAACNLKKET